MTPTAYVRLIAAIIRDRCHRVDASKLARSYAAYINGDGEPAILSLGANTVAIELVRKLTTEINARIGTSVEFYERQYDGLGYGYLKIKIVDWRFLEQLADSLEGVASKYDQDQTIGKHE